MKIEEKERNLPRPQGDSSLLQHLSTKIIFRAKLHIASHGEMLTVLLCFVLGILGNQDSECLAWVLVSTLGFMGGTGGKVGA